MNERRSVCAVILAAVLAIALNSKANAQTQSAKTSGDDFKSRFEKHQRKVDRHIEITPKQDGGINSGLVVVFGHLVKPPYKILFDNNHLLVNGVIVRPSPIQQREHGRIDRSSTTAEVAYAKKISSLMSAAQEMYRETPAAMSQAQMESQILDFVKTQDIVADAKWTAASAMDVTVRDANGASFRLVIQFSKTAPISKTPDEINANAAKNQGHHVQRLEEELGRGQCLFFSTDGGESNCSILRNAEFQKRISAIMSNAKLSEEDRLAQVRKCSGSANLGHFITDT
jgi:hypothetical protein